MSNRHRDSFRIERLNKSDDIDFIFCEINLMTHVYKISGALNGNWNHVVLSKHKFYKFIIFNFIFIQNYIYKKYNYKYSQRLGNDKGLYEWGHIKGNCYNRCM